MGGGTPPSCMMGAASGAGALWGGRGALVVAQGTRNRKFMLSTDEVPQLVMWPCFSSAALTFAAHSSTAVFSAVPSLNVADVAGADGKGGEGGCGAAGGR